MPHLPLAAVSAQSMSLTAWTLACSVLSFQLETCAARCLGCPQACKHLEHTRQTDGHTSEGLWRVQQHCVCLGGRPLLDDFIHDAKALGLGGRHEVVTL